MRKIVCEACGVDLENKTQMIFATYRTNKQPEQVKQEQIHPPGTKMRVGPHGKNANRIYVIKGYRVNKDGNVTKYVAQFSDGSEADEDIRFSAPLEEP